MLVQKLLKSAIFLLLLLTLASCYTQFGVVRVEPVEDEYGYEGEPAQEEIYEDDVVVYRQVYIDRYYHPGNFYFDPYDGWYFEPGIHFSIGYYYGPVYYTPVHYFPPYYGYPVYVCTPPVYYPPYWHPGYHPVFYPVYYPGPYYGHSGPHYAYSPKNLTRRSFGRRTDTAIASRTTVTRRGSGTQLTRRTVSSGDDNSGGRYARRISDSRRRDNSPDPDNGTYKRQVVRKRTDNSGSSGYKPFSYPRINSTETKKVNETKKSNGSDSGTGYQSSPKKPSSTIVSGEAKKSYSGSEKPASTRTPSGSSPRVTQSGSGSKGSSVTRSRSTGTSRSSSPARVTRSSSGSRSSGSSRSVSSGSTRSSGSSKSSTGSGKSRRR